MSVNPIGESYKVWIIHQSAARLFRKDVAASMLKVIKELEPLESDRLNDLIEEDANYIEKQFLRMYSEVPEEESDRVPVFDFEIM